MAPKDRLIYLALGGAGEIGMNFYLYGYGPAGKERFIAVDVGVTFPDMDGSPGVDLIMADAAWIAARAARLDGIFITHAHEDHVGALGMLWDRLRAPVHARRFTAAIARAKMERFGQDPREVRETPPWPHMVEAGPFRVGFMPISHSIPESSSLVIETPAGRVLHTADFKIDPTPVVGDAFDEAAFRALGDAGVKAMVCDSTNVFSPRPGRSEATLAEPITALMREAEGLVAATTFASNVARLKTLAEAGRAAGRRVVVLGRAMRTMIQTARDTGVLGDFPATLAPEEAQDFRRGELMLLVTGSQGERRAASAQLSVGRYMGFELQVGDLFLFSSKTIPGNEKSVARILNALSERGVRTVDDSSEAYHVSGHANRPDLATMQDLVRPGAIVPMHGEHRHLSAHAAFAAERGFRRRARAERDGARPHRRPARDRRSRGDRADLSRRARADRRDRRRGARPDAHGAARASVGLDRDRRIRRGAGRRLGRGRRACRRSSSSRTGSRLRSRRRSARSCAGPSAACSPTTARWRSW